MNKFLTFIFTTLILSAFSQVGMGQWQIFPSPYIVKDVANSNDVVYGLLEKGILEYDPAEGEQSLWTAANYLSDVHPTALAYEPSFKTLIIGYDNGNVDLLRKNKVINIPAILQSNINGIKKINNIITKGRYVYLVTGIGIIVIDLKKKEVKDTYNPSPNNEEYIDLTIKQDSIFVLTENKVYTAHKDNNFLAVSAQWEEVSYLPDYSSDGKFTGLEEFSNHLFLTFKNESTPNADTLFQIDNGQFNPFVIGGSLSRVSASNNKLYVSNYYSVTIYDLGLNELTVLFQTENQYSLLPNNACFLNGYYYIADNSLGLIKAKNSFSTDRITFPGPRYNSSYRVKWRKGKLSVACGGLSGVGPSFNSKGGATMEDEKWISTSVYNQSMLHTDRVWDFVSTAVNPANTEEVAYGTISPTPLVLTNKGNVTDTFSLANSILEGDQDTKWGYVSALTYDDDGNLWIGNSSASKPLKVIAKNGLWYEFNLANQIKNKRVERLIIDNNGVKWMGVKEGGVLAFDEGESISDASDDRYRLLNTGANSGALPTNDVKALAADFDNNIWVGTVDGLRVLYNSENVFDAAAGEYNFKKLLIEYGENVEIVLGTSQINSIQVDGDNRKWIGTANAGVFLLSADGLEVIRNFTAENSSLLSNSILDIAIDQTTGIVYFVTEKGLIGYRSDATEGDQEYSNVKVFPNPVQPNFDGPITIQGIAYNSDVKITDVSGKVIYKTKSHGGTATWSGNTMDGRRAATGVYLIWTSIDSDEFKGRKVGKVLLVN